MSQGYRVEGSHGCKVIIGAVPVSDFVALTRAWSELEQEGEEWIVDGLLAQSLGANFVLGPKAACLAWRTERGIE
jgi:hypothetical protein